FSEGKTPAEVAIELKIRAPQAIIFCREYWDLARLGNLNQIYREIQHDIWFFVELYRSTKAARIGIPHVIKLLQVANNDLPGFEYRFQRLEQEVETLEFEKRNSARIFQDFENRVIALGKRFDSYCISCQEEEA